eukprot:scaffold11371_cov74-Attheya_sp.AAC.2
MAGDSDFSCAVVTMAGDLEIFLCVVTMAGDSGIFLCLQVVSWKGFGVEGGMGVWLLLAYRQHLFHGRVDVLVGLGVGVGFGV